jgi:hypothetical protein
MVMLLFSAAGPYRYLRVVDHNWASSATAQPQLPSYRKRYRLSRR